MTGWDKGLVRTQVASHEVIYRKVSFPLTLSDAYSIL